MRRHGAPNSHAEKWSTYYEQRSVGAVPGGAMPGGAR
jgi:hypothetical protein